MDEGTHGLPAWAPFVPSHAYNWLPFNSTLGLIQVLAHPCRAVILHMSSASARCCELTSRCKLLGTHSGTKLVIVSQVVKCMHTHLQEWGLHPLTPTLRMQQMPAPPQTGPSAQI